jgi:hypothetical protein
METLIDMSRIVYVKEVVASDLPKPLADQLPRDIGTKLFATYSSEGEPLSLAQSRKMAEAAARQYNLEPFSVH